MIIIVKILFDETQKERGRIFNNFRILAHDLEQQGFKIGVYDSYPIKYSSIKDANVITFLCPDGSKLYAHEIKGLIRFVEEGGGLAIFANAGGDRGLNTNLNALLKHFNIELVSNQVFDYFNYDAELERCPVVKKIFSHPITENVKELTYVTGCSLSIGYDVIELARTQTTSTPPSATILAAKIFGKGKVVVCGSYLMFSDREAGINLRDNRILAINIFKWLAAPLRAEDKGPVHVQVKKQDTLKGKIVKAVEDKKVQQKPPISQTKEKEKGEEGKKAKLTSQKSSLTEEEIEKAIQIIKEIEAEIEAMGIIEDPSYKEIILTDMARKRGIDYTKILPYLEEREKEKEKEKEKEEEKPTKDERQDLLMTTMPMEIGTVIKQPEEPSKRTIYRPAVSTKQAAPPKEVSTAKAVSEEIMDISNKLLSAIKGLESSIKDLTIALNSGLKEITNELKEIKKHLKGE